MLLFGDITSAIIHHTLMYRIVGEGREEGHFQFSGRFNHLFHFIMTPPPIKNVYKATNLPPY